MRLLSRLNGWQRLWFVIAAGFVAYGVFIQPFRDCDAGHLSSIEYGFKLERDLENPNCKAYQTDELSQLKEPPFSEWGGTCWHLYNSRKYNNVVPYTFEVYESGRLQRLYSCLGIGALIYGLIAVILAAMLYGAGAIIAWIRGGFKTA
jgi:hypothetical protein